MADYLEAVRKAMPMPGDFEQCYAFSIHKAGSTLMHRMIGEVCGRIGIPAASIPDVMFKEGLNERDWEADVSLGALIVPGRVYYGFRMFPSFIAECDPDLRKRPVVLLVRDPRDALVSQFYSFGGKHLSHRLPDKNTDRFLETIRKTADLEVDDYVLQQAGGYLRKMKAYATALDLNSIMLRRYEDVYFDKRRFVGDVFETFGITVPPDVLDDVASSNDVRPDSERIGKHIRKGAPGDHREKLQAETIAKLNEIFGETSKQFGYDLRS